MLLNLYRKWKTDKSTIGELHLDGAFFCWTLEDVERKLGVKVVGETCIPHGTYKVVIDFSERFGKRMPHIMDVPGFTGIRIHSGNKAADTAGCILVGDTKGDDFIGQSKVAYERLFRKLDGQTDITLEIT